MKRLLLCALLGAAAFGAKASHLMGGEVTLSNIGPNQYELRLTEYRDVMGVPLITPELIDRYSYDPGTNTYTLDTTYVMDLNAALSTALIPNFPYGIEIGVYNDTINLAAGQYRFVMSQCCRNAAILNMTDPGSESMLLYTDLTVDANGGNSSATFLTTPVAYFPVNDTITFNPLPYDPDGDSLVWALNTPYGGASMGSGFGNVIGFTAPASDPAGPFTLNPVSGEITWIPNTVGNWVQSFIVDEYRNGVKIGSVVRDFQYVVVPDTSANNQNSPQFMVSNPNVNYNATQGYNWMYYFAGQPLQFEIGGTDLDAGATLELQSFSEIFLLPNNPAVFNVVNNGNNISGTLDWTPDATYSKDVILVFRLRDGMWSKDYTLLLTKNDNTSVGSTPSSVANVTVYPNPASTTLNIAVDLAKDMTGDIAMYSAIGQKVATLQAGKLVKGNHQFSQNINVASGMYYVVVRNGNQIVKTIPVAVK